MSKRPDTKKRISLGVSQKKQDATMDRLLKKPKRTKLDREVDEGLSAIDRALAKRMKPAARPQRAAKTPWYSGRKVFVYAEELRVGDVIELHSSVEWKKGMWRNEICRGPVIEVDKETNRLYSKTIVTVKNLEWTGDGLDTQPHSLSNMSYIRLLP